MEKYEGVMLEDAIEKYNSLNWSDWFDYFDELVDAFDAVDVDGIEIAFLNYIKQLFYV